MTVYTYAASPIGDLLIVGDGTRVEGLYFPEHRRGPNVTAGWKRDDTAFAEVRQQLAAYFASRLRHFEADLAPSGTVFQQQVWSALRAIPFGATMTYGDLARSIGRPAAARAVGAAVARNPISIIVPCHRVVGSSGAMTGFAGGVPRKQRLLSLEQEALAHSAGAPALA